MGGSKAQTDFFGILGDNFYDRDGRATKHIFSQLTTATKVYSFIHPFIQTTVAIHRILVYIDCGGWAAFVALDSAAQPCCSCFCSTAMLYVFEV